MATRTKTRRAEEKPRDYHHGDLREALIRATLGIVQTTGPSGVTLRGVAKAARVSEAAPYHHFRDKSDLLASVAAVSFDALRERLREGLASESGNPRAALVALGVAWVQFALDEPGSFRLLFGAHVDDLARFELARTAGRKTKALVRGAVRDFVDTETLQVDPEWLFRLLWAQVHGIAWLTLEHEFGRSFTHAEALVLAGTGIDRLLAGLVESERIGAS